MTVKTIKEVLVLAASEWRDGEEPDNGYVYMHKIIGMRLEFDFSKKPPFKVLGKEIVLRPAEIALAHLLCNPEGINALMRCNKLEVPVDFLEFAEAAIIKTARTNQWPMIYRSGGMDVIGVLVAIQAILLFHHTLDEKYDWDQLVIEIPKFEPMKLCSFLPDFLQMGTMLVRFGQAARNALAAKVAVPSVDAFPVAMDEKGILTRGGMGGISVMGYFTDQEAARVGVGVSLLKLVVRPLLKQINTALASFVEDVGNADGKGALGFMHLYSISNTYFNDVINLVAGCGSWSTLIGHDACQFQNEKPADPWDVMFKEAVRLGELCNEVELTAQEAWKQMGEMTKQPPPAP